jgi:hypothetical protein
LNRRILGDCVASTQAKHNKYNAIYKTLVGVRAALKPREIKGLERKTGQGGCIESQGLSGVLENSK